MIPSSHLERLLLKAVQEVLHELVQQARQFTADLERLTNEILQALPRDGWRNDLDHFFDHWVDRGLRAEPESITMLKRWIAEQEALCVSAEGRTSQYVFQPTPVQTSQPIGLLKADSSAPASVAPPRPLRRIETAYGLPDDFVPPLKAKVLEQLGRVIMASHPPERWLDIATRDVPAMDVTNAARDKFLAWIASEQAGALRIKEASKALRSKQHADRFEQRLANLRNDLQHLEELIRLFGAELDAGASEPEIELDRAVDAITETLQRYNRRLIETLQAWLLESNQYKDLDRLVAMPTPAGLGLPLHATNELAESELAEWRKLQQQSDAHAKALGRVELGLKIADWTATTATVILTAGTMVAVKEGGKRVLVKLAAATIAGMYVEAGAERAARKMGASDEIIAGAKLAAAIVSYIILKRRAGSQLPKAPARSNSRPFASAAKPLNKRPEPKTAKPYDVDTAAELRKNPVPGTQVHHAPQSREAEVLVGDFKSRNRAGKEPAIRLPRTEHDVVTTAQMKRGTLPSARDLLASDVRILRKHTAAPTSSLKKVIRMNKDLHRTITVRCIGKLSNDPVT